MNVPSLGMFAVRSSYMGARSQYSTMIGSILHHNNFVEVLIPRGLPSDNQKSQQLRDYRETALKITESAVLRKQLGTIDRATVFDGDPSKSVWRDFDSAPTFTMRWGNTTKDVKLTPRKQKGNLGRKVITTIITTCGSASEVNEATNALEECLKSPKLRANIQESMFATLLKCAATFGVYEETFARMISPDNIFRKHLRGSFYLEALRIHALRAPFYSKSKQEPKIMIKFITDLRELHVRAKPCPTREILMTYALAFIYDISHQFEGFGGKEIQHIVEESAQESLKFCRDPLKTHSSITRVDLLLYHEALRLKNTPELELTRRKVQSYLSRRSKQRSLQQHLKIDVTDIGTTASSMTRWGSLERRFLFFERNESL